MQEVHLGEKRTILLVEDNPDDEELTVRVLRRHQVASNIDVVRDGQEAVEYLFDSSSTKSLPDLVLMDLKLPKVGGLDLLFQIRGHDRTKLLPVVVLTSSSEEQDIVTSFARGANSYIRKPVAFDEFQETVRQVGVYWLTLNEAVQR